MSEENSGAGKGDQYRKVDGKKYRSNYDLIFKKAKEHEKILIDCIIGKSLKEIKKKFGLVRVTRLNGDSFIVTMDYKPNRLNVEIVGNKVVAFHWG